MGCVSSRRHQTPGQFDAHGLKYPSSPKTCHRRKCAKKKNTFKQNPAACSNGVNHGNPWRKKASQCSINDQDYWKVFDSYPFENLVLSGGGSKGYAFVGALQALQDCSVLSRIRRVAGSSSGAICAGLIAIGCTPQEIADVFSSDPKWLFQDQGCAPVYCVPNIWKKYGLHPGNRFYNLYGKAITEQLGNPDITFKELYDIRGVELCIVVTNLNRMCAEYCHATTTPDLPIRKAVRMSMSFPVIYQPIQADLNQGETCWYTDGGMLDQYPIHCFDGTKFEMNHNSEKSKESLEEKFNVRTLGLYVVSETPLDYQIWDALFSIEIPYKPSYVPKTKLAKERLKGNYPRRIQPRRFKTIKDTSRWIRGSPRHCQSSESLYHWPVQEQNVDIKSFSDFVATTIEALLVNQRKSKVKSNDVFRTIPINCGYVGTNDYDIEAGDREFLVRQGYQCSHSFLTDYINQDYESKVKALQHRNTTEKSVQTDDRAVHPGPKVDPLAHPGVHRQLSSPVTPASSVCGTAAGLHNPLMPVGLAPHLWRRRVNSMSSSVATASYTGTGVYQSATDTGTSARCSCGVLTSILSPPLALSEASVISGGSVSSINSLTSAGHMCVCNHRSSTPTFLTRSPGTPPRLPGGIVNPKHRPSQVPGTPQSQRTPQTPRSQAVSMHDVSIETEV